MAEQLRLYEDVVVITLAEQGGKERPLGDAFLAQVYRLNSPRLTYVAFDFHEHCRGMKFENVSLLTDHIKDIVKDMRYCWVDNKGLICEQRGVFRINCIDCLDRTNVVQTAIARIIMETQFRKLGLLPPEENLPPSCRRVYQQLWANNGDAISRQYAGTAALKGDFTRTGERKLTGLMKDGVNSANRYYLRFKDAYRQAMIDMTLGLPVSEEVLSLSSSSSTTRSSEEDSNELLEKEENLKLLIEDSKKMLIVEPEQCLGGWGLINADPSDGDSDRQEMDIILLLSQRAVYVAWYDDDEEQVTQYQRIFLEDIDKVEIGLEQAIFKSRFVCLRIHYHTPRETGFFHTLRVPSSRLFNNIVIAVKNQEEAKESLRAIVQSFEAAQKSFAKDELNLEVVEKQKLDRKKTLPHPDVVDVHKQQQESSLAGIHLPRDISADIIPSADAAAGAARRETGEELGDKNPLSRPKSPMEYLLPAALRAPFSKPSLSSLTSLNLSSRLALPQGGLRASIQGATSKFTRAFYTPDKVDGTAAAVNINSSQNDEALRRCSQDSQEEVVLDSCGILATNPVQVIVTSQKLGERPLSISEDAALELPAFSAGQSHKGSDVDGKVQGASGSVQQGGKSATGRKQGTTKGKGVENYAFDESPRPHGSKDDGNSADPGDLIDLSSPRDSPASRSTSPAKPSSPGKKIDQAAKVKTPPDAGGKHEKEKKAPGSPSLLSQPVMKVSLSDSHLMRPPAGEAPGPSSGTRGSTQLPGDSSPFSRIKQGLSSVNLPVVASSTSSLAARNQRMLEFIGKLKLEKLGDQECHTKVIVI